MAVLIAGTVTPSVVSGGVVITLSAPPAVTGGAAYYVYWKGRSESRFKKQPARNTAGVISTMIPIPPQRGMCFVQVIDSTGATFNTPVIDVYPMGGNDADYTQFLIPEKIGFGSGAQGVQKAISFTVGNGKASGIKAPVKDLQPPLGCGLTTTKTLSVNGKVGNYAFSVASLSNEGIYHNGSAY